MITDRDITKLKSVFATKEELADLKLEVVEMHDKIDGMHNKFDAFLGMVTHLDLENAAGGVVLSRHTRQIQALADNTHTILPE